MNRSIAVLSSCFVILAAGFGETAFAQASNQRPHPGTKSAVPASSARTRLPTKEDVEAGLQRTLGYDPSISWEIFDIRASAVPGMAEVIISINKQVANHLYLSPDGENAIIGELIPFGLNPFARARQLLKAANGPARGAQTPVIFLVEFSDLECPHCKVSHPILEKLASDFPQVRVVFQQFPLPASMHPWAMKAAEYADCAGQISQESFWKYLDGIFENQAGITLATADEKLKELATAAGLDAEKVAACAATPETEARVKKSLELGQSLEVNETPTVFINGRRVKSIATIPYDQLKSLVQFEIAHAGK